MFPGAGPTGPRLPRRSSLRKTPAAGGVLKQAGEEDPSAGVAALVHRPGCGESAGCLPLENLPGREEWEDGAAGAIQPRNPPRGEIRLVAIASGDGDLVAAFGAAAAEHGSACLGSHAGEEAVDFATAAAVGLEGALGHRIRPVSKDVCWACASDAGGWRPGKPECESPRGYPRSHLPKSAQRPRGACKQPSSGLRAVWEHLRGCTRRGSIQKCKEDAARRWPKRRLDSKF